MVRIKKIAIRLVLSIIALVLLATFLVQIPSIQAKLVNYTASTLTSELGLKVDVEGVELKPLRGSVSLSGINCTDSENDINLSCEEFNIKGIKALLNKQIASDLILSNVNLVADSHESLISFIENLPKSEGGSSAAIDLDRLQINVLSVQIADTFTTYIESLTAENISITEDLINVEDFSLTEAYILDHKINLQGGLSYFASEGLQLKLNKLEHPQLSASGDLELDSNNQLTAELEIEATPDSLLIDYGVSLGEVQGHISYADSIISVDSLTATTGYFIESASASLDLSEWNVKGIAEIEEFTVDIEADGHLESILATVSEPTIGSAEIIGEYKDSEWICAIYSDTLMYENIKLTNVEAALKGDTSLSDLDISVVSNEIITKANCVTDVDLWEGFIESGKTNEYLSKGSLILKRSNFIASTFGIPTSISRGSEVHWDLNGVENTLQGSSERATYQGAIMKGVFFDLLSSGGDTWGNLSSDEIVVSRNNELQVLATGISADLHRDSVWAIDTYWENTSHKTGQVRLEGIIDGDNLNFKVYEATLPIAEDTLILADAPAELQVKGNELVSEEMTWTGGGFKAELEGSVGDSTFLSFALTTHSIDTTRSHKWFNVPFETDSIIISGRASGSLKNPYIQTTFESNNVKYRGSTLPNTIINLTHVDGHTKMMGVISGLGDREGSFSFNGELLDEGINLESSAKHLPIDMINPFLPENTVNLNGYLAGRFHMEGALETPEISGLGQFEDVLVEVEYLNTSYNVDGGFTINPDGIELNAIDVHDENNSDAILVGTILHENFQDWNLDITLMLDEEPMKIMDIPYSPEDYFYGTGYGTGHINVFSFEDQIVIEANLTTHEGTEFVLPMEVASDSDWSTFVSIKSDEEAPKHRELYTNTKVKLNLNLDVLESSKARIVFDEAVGDEIVGSCKGHIHIGIDDFERLEMFGDLEVVEGSYLFTLGKFFNKKFVARPGGRISWFGDPYEADIDIETVYTTSASIQPIMPDAGYSSKQKVEVELELKGELMKPGIVFDIVLPESSGEAQAALASHISNEEERNRQAMSLLVLHQFIPGSIHSAAIGSTGLQENSSELITSQLGNWLSSMSDDVSIGINYDSATDTGDEAAIAVALSTQILNDRLHIEGEVGTQNLYSGSMDDVQLQDVRIKYDLNETGNLQLTGYTTQRTDIPGFEGESVQGVGLLYHKDFDRFIDFFKRDR